MTSPCSYWCQFSTLHRLTMVPLFVTNCTGRKRQPPAAGLTARSLPQGTYQALAENWTHRVADATERFFANEVYCGRAMTETRKAADAVNAEILFVSAGLGAVSWDARIPSYSLTAVSGSPDSIENKLCESYDSREWWRTLNGFLDPQYSLRQRMLRYKGGLIVVALPRSYLELTQDSFVELPAPIQEKLRVVGPRRVSDVPEHLRSHWLPYDARFDDARTGYNGTASDFPHRALNHFATRILSPYPGESVTEHRRRVDLDLSNYVPYVRPRGASASDEEILALIRDLWPIHAGLRNKILRDLRSNRGIACEQSRFKSLADRFERGANGTAP